MNQIINLLKSTILSHFKDQYICHQKLVDLKYIGGKITRSRSSIMEGEKNVKKRLSNIQTENHIESHHDHTKGTKNVDSCPTFVARTNPVTGKMDWIVQDENYDYIQEIARSGYGDMLHDKDRNEKYYKAIGQAVKLLKEQNKQVRSLDIGTGTGLLSMMAAIMGADVVTACEAFSPMAACAQKVIEVNGFKDKIKLIPKRSTDVTLDDIGERANLLVTELFDTELIGEGAIGSYTDAHARLMEDDCIAVPSSGLMYIQPIQCDFLALCNSLQTVQLPNNTAVSMPKSLGTCSGAPLLHDLQVDELRAEIRPLSSPVQVFKFDFGRKNALPKHEQTQHNVTAIEGGRIDAFVMWWDLKMDPLGEIILSCAPCWNRDSSAPIPWRDHWMQAVYYPTLCREIKKGDNFTLYSYHDEYSLWFDTQPTQRILPSCSCGLHVTFSRNRIGQLNEYTRNTLFINLLQKHITKDTVCLVISDGSLLPLMAARLEAKKVFYLDGNHATRKFVKELIRHNNLEDKIVLLDKSAEDILPEDLLNLKIDLVIAEPFLQAALLPWEHLYFWYALHYLKSLLSENVVILPESMTVKAMAVQFRDLHKIRAPVGICEGFDISEFDQLIKISSDSIDDSVEPQPLWEYPSEALSSPTSIAFLDFTKSPVNSQQLKYSVDIMHSRDGVLNGLALWAEYKFGQDVLSTGLLYDDQSHVPKWDKFSKQGVILYHNAKAVKKETKFNMLVAFNPDNGDFCIKVE